MNKDTYKDYYKTHIAYLSGNNDNYLFSYFETNIYPLLRTYNKQIKILDIGCGKGVFAKYLKSKKFSNYVGLDLDENQILKNQKELDGYSFLYENGIDYLKHNDDKFDFIFMSHVAEHLYQTDLDRLIREIFIHLQQGGVFINIMPNGASLFSSNIGRYADYTHKNLYTENSFSQILLKSGFKDIEHNNSRPTFLLLQIARKIFKFFIKIFVLFLGYPYPKVDTFEIITIAKK